jgi:hypothetical protein
MPGKKDGDSILILTTDTVTKVMEQYIQDHEMRRKVKVVNLQVKGDAYAFSLEYVEEDIPGQQVVSYPDIGNIFTHPLHYPLPGTSVAEEDMKAQLYQHRWGMSSDGLVQDKVPIYTHPLHKPIDEPPCSTIPAKRSKNGRFTKIEEES